MKSRFKHIPEFMTDWKEAGEPLDDDWYNDFLWADCPPNLSVEDGGKRPCDICEVDESDCKKLLDWKDVVRRYNSLNGTTKEES